MPVNSVSLRSQRAHSIRFSAVASRINARVLLSLELQRSQTSSSALRRASWALLLQAMTIQIGFPSEISDSSNGAAFRELLCRGLKIHHVNCPSLQDAAPGSRPNDWGHVSKLRRNRAMVGNQRQAVILKSVD